MKPIKNLKAVYDSNAEAYAAHAAASEAALPALRALMALLPPKPRILDLGCGTGHESARMQALGAEVVGLDFSERSLAIARKAAPGAAFHAGDMLDDYTRLGCFDAVVAIASFVHLPPEKLPAAFSRAAAVLRPGGSMLLLVLHGEGKQAQFGNPVIGGVEYDREIYAQTPEALSACCADLLRYAAEVCPGTRTPWRWHLFERA